MVSLEISIYSLEMFLQGNSFATLFPCKIFQGVYFVTLFCCKRQKINYHFIASQLLTICDKGIFFFYYLTWPYACLYFKHGLDTNTVHIIQFLDVLPQLYSVHSLLGGLTITCLLGPYSID